MGLEAEETLDLGNGVGFRVLFQKGRPVGSGGELELRYAAVSVWDDGRVVRMTNYGDIPEARAAAERLAENGGKRYRRRTWRSLSADSSTS